MKIKIFLVFVLIIIASLTYANLKPTTIKKSENFSGIADLKKQSTNIIIVHGIGNHCIGYADSMISNIMNDISDNKWENIKNHYEKYLKTSFEIYGKSSPKITKENNSIEQDKIYFPRNKYCSIDTDDKKSIDFLTALHKKENNLINESEIKENDQDNPGLYKTDMEIVINGQDDLCEFIHSDSKEKSRNSNSNSIDCYKLSVNYYPDKDTPIQKYITGFVRRISSKPTSNRTINIFELTWNPATRWLKQSFNVSERINGKVSDYFYNKKLKSQVVNSAIADAIAYLSDSGILVNFDLLETFCLSMVEEKKSTYLPYEFSCSPNLLQTVSTDFQEKNDVVIISHSLGTRVVFDTLGLLSKGDAPNLMKTIETKFTDIGAVIPDKYTNNNPATEKQKSFKDLLASRIPGFINAISSIYIFTNQIPLLEANITSPFKSKKYEMGTEFSAFIDKRNSQLQVVSFHDPDDLLSYNLKCWYQNTILKHSEKTIDFIEDQAKEVVANKNTSEEIDAIKLAEARRTIRNELFGVCSKKELSTKAYENLYKSIWSESDKKLKLVDVTVRLRSEWTIPWLINDPSGIHSNYFSDTKIHDWLINGNN